MPEFNYVDLLLGVMLLLSLWRGWRTGFIAGVVLLFFLLAGLVAAGYGTAQLAALINRMGWVEEPWASPAAFVALFFAVQMAMGIFVQYLRRPVLSRGFARALNRAFGLLPGAANAVINMTVVAIVLSNVPIDEDISVETGDSQLVEALAPLVEWVEQQAGPVFRPAFARGLQLLEVQPEPRQQVPSQRLHR